MNNSLPLSCVSSASFNERDFRDALGQFATGVTVVTTVDAQQHPVGMTVSSFNSVSLNPALVLWSLGCKAGCYDAFAQASHYVIHVLSEQQKELALQFSKRGIDRFANITWQPNAYGIPVLAHAVATFECSARSQYMEGDHLIMVGQVQASHHSVDMQPLVYHAGQMR